MIEISIEENKHKFSQLSFPSNSSSTILEKSSALNDVKSLIRNKGIMNIGRSGHQMLFGGGNKRKLETWQQMAEKKSIGNTFHWDCETKLSEGSEYMGLVRTHSAPTLNGDS